jgi:hypothetical protein
MEIRIRLTWPEISIAALVGSLRNIQSLQRDWAPHAGVGLTNTWTPNIEGVAGEMAVAKHCGVYWLPVVGDPDADDAGPFQVRTNTSRRLDDMILRPRDFEKGDRIYVSVLSFLPEFILCGWIRSSEAKREEWCRDGTVGRPPCFFVPRGALNPISTLMRQGQRRPLV